MAMPNLVVPKPYDEVLCHPGVPLTMYNSVVPSDRFFGHPGDRAEGHNLQLIQKHHLQLLLH